MISPCKKPEKGDWLFTCMMQPKQFSHFERACMECGRFYPTTETVCTKCNVPLKEELDDFVSIDGSCHSKKHCTLHLISTKYATWFIENKLWELYTEEDGFDIYREKVKDLCKKTNIVFEGI